jgi:hypothetical protein
VFAFAAWLLSPPAIRAQSLTAISDTLYNADGSTANGRLVISWEPFTASGGETIDGGIRTYSITNGTINISLVANVGATPSGTSYQARYFLSNGSSYTETWVVPAAGPVTIAEVRQLNAPELGAAIPPQYVQGGTPNRCARFDASGVLASHSSDCGAGGGGGGHTIEDEGAPLTQRAGLNFVGAAITATDDAGNDETNVTVTIDDSTVPDNITLANITQITNRAIGDTTGDLAASRVDDGGAAATQALFSGQAGAAGFRTIADGDVPNNITIDLAATATELAANGANCSAGNYPLGIDAFGAVENCTADDDVPEAGDYSNLTGGAGIVNIPAGTIATASQETGFVADGGTASLSCGVSASGQMQVMDDGTLEWCDGQATAALRSAALGDGSGNALAGDSATGFFPDQNAGTDITADLEEEAHESEHRENGADELLGENLGTACSENQILKTNASGGLDCAADATGGSPTFDQIGSGTNTSAAMVVGSGASLRSATGILGVPNSTTLPGNCTVGDVYFDNDASIGLRFNLCTATDTWTAFDNPFGTTIDDGELANSYSGVGGCTDQFPRTLNDNASPTCADVAPADFASQSANTVLAAPDGAAGEPTFRALADGDIPAAISRDSEWPSATATLTNKTLDTEGSGNSLITVEKVVLVAAGCNNTTAGPGWDIPTSNGPAATCYGTSPQRFGGLDFADGASALTSTTHLRLPSDWTGNIDATFIWFSGSTSTNSVVWTLATACIADGEGLLSPSFNTTQTVSDANNSTANTRNSASIASITTTGCAAGETLFLRIGRDPTNGSDALAATAALLEFELTLRRAQ